MAAMVSAIVALAVFATYSTAIVPGIETGSIAVQAIYVVLAIIYFLVVSTARPRMHMDIETAQQDAVPVPSVFYY